MRKVWLVKGHLCGKGSVEWDEVIRLPYQIIYGPMPPVKQAGRHGILRFQVLTAAFMLLFVITVRHVWPEGTQTLREFLIPGEPTVTEAAFHEMMADIQDGEPLPDALTAFCRQIVDESIGEEA